MRPEKPKYFMVLFLVLILILGGLGAYFMLRNDQVAPAQAADTLPIQTYSLNGEVTSFSGNSLTANFGILQGNSESGNSIVIESKTVLVSDTTDISTVQINNGAIVRTDGSVADIRPGVLIAVYTSTKPTSAEFQADRIEILVE